MDNKIVQTVLHHYRETLATIQSVIKHEATDPSKEIHIDEFFTLFDSCDEWRSFKIENLTPNRCNLHACWYYEKFGGYEKAAKWFQDLLDVFIIMRLPRSCDYPLHPSEKYQPDTNVDEKYLWDCCDTRAYFFVQNIKAVIDCLMNDFQHPQLIEPYQEGMDNIIIQQMIAYYRQTLATVQSVLKHETTDPTRKIHIDDFFTLIESAINWESFLAENFSGCIGRCGLHADWFLQQFHDDYQKAAKWLDDLIDVFKILRLPRTSDHLPLNDDEYHKQKIVTFDFKRMWEYSDTTAYIFIQNINAINDCIKKRYANRIDSKTQ